MSYLTNIRYYIIENFLFGDGVQLHDDTSFLESGIIDSTGILEIVNFLEQEYGITIDDEDLIPQNFDTLININRFLTIKMKDGE